MSRQPISRLLAELPARQEKLQDSKGNWVFNSKNTLSDSDKRNIWNVLKATRDKVVELITLLDWYDTTPDWKKVKFYWRSQWQLKKIRPLKNEVAGSYFAVWETLRTHWIGSDKLIQDYYSRVRGFKQGYHATTLKSEDIRNFHERIQNLIGWVLKKALKSD